MHKQHFNQHIVCLGIFTYDLILLMAQKVNNYFTLKYTNKMKKQNLIECKNKFNKI